MSDLYERIVSLCQSRQMNLTKMCKEAKISRASLSDLKMGRKQTLNTKTLMKIADYFQVSVDFLLGQEEKETPSEEKDSLLTKKDQQDIAKDFEQLKSRLESDEMLMFDGDYLSQEARESMLAAMKLGLEAVKLRNKEKYTPKKYQKRAKKEGESL